MMTLELDDETARLLTHLVEQEHMTPAQLIKNVLLEHMEDLPKAKRMENGELLTDIIKTLPELPSFQGDPVAIQRAMRDEWN